MSGIIYICTGLVWYEMSSEVLNRISRSL